MPMPPRFFVDLPLHAGESIRLPAGVTRHVQVLRLQPGAPVVLFNGLGGEWPARVLRMGRSDVDVQVDSPTQVDHEPATTAVTLAFGMPANERMDAVIEKATELGVAAIQPLICERSVLRLVGERAQKKRAHWRAVAVAACEQSGRTRLPRIEPVAGVHEWLQNLPPQAGDCRWVLSLAQAQPVAGCRAASAVVCLSGPEGGLSGAEEGSACELGFLPVSLGPHVLRADTAPLAVLSYLALRGAKG